MSGRVLVWALCQATAGITLDHVCKCLCMCGAHVSVSVDPVHRGLDRVRCRLAVLVCSCAFLPFSPWPPIAHQPHSNAQGCHSLTLSGCAVSPFSVCSLPCLRHCRVPHFSLCPASPLCRGTLGVHFRGHLFHSHTVCACTRTHAFRAAQAWRCQWRGARVLSRSFLGHLFSLETPATCGGLVCGLYGTYAEKKKVLYTTVQVCLMCRWRLPPPPPSRTWGSSLAFEAPSAKFVTTLPPQTLIGCTVAQEAHAYTARLLRFSMTPLRPVFFHLQYCHKQNLSLSFSRLLVAWWWCRTLGNRLRVPKGDSAGCYFSIFLASHVCRVRLFASEQHTPREIDQRSFLSCVKRKAYREARMIDVSVGPMYERPATMCGEYSLQPSSGVCRLGS